MDGKTITLEPGWTLCTDVPMNFIVGPIENGKAQVLAVPRMGKLNQPCRDRQNRVIRLTIAYESA